VVLATGSKWRRDGQGAIQRGPARIEADARTLTPDDIFRGARLSGRVLIYDDEHYMMAGALAEKLLASGLEVTYITPETMVSSWTVMTNEQAFIQARLSSMGLDMVFSQMLEAVETGAMYSRCGYSGKAFRHEFDQLVLVTGRSSVDDLHAGLGIAATRIGDCLVPSSIADAVYSGHKFAREFGEDPATLVCRRERALLQPLPPIAANPSRRSS
jgi:dimethylamine/trimethylamine dehydrogenase